MLSSPLPPKRDVSTVGPVRRTCRCLDCHTELDAGEPEGIELKAVCARTTQQGGTNTNTWNFGVGKESVVTVAAYQRRAGVLGTDAVGTSTSADQLVGLGSDQGVTRVGSRDRAVKGRHQ